MVSDNSGSAERAVRELTRSGYAVSPEYAQARYEFEVRLRGGNYDVILTAASLRGWSALDLLATRGEVRSGIPVIVLGETGAGDVALQCVQAGAADFITVDNIQMLPTAVARAVADARSLKERAAANDLVGKLTLAIDQSPASIIFTDTSGTIQYVNHRFTEVTGYTAEEAIGRTPSIVRSGRNPRAVYSDLWRTIRAGKVWRGELQNRRKNGELYWDSVSISPIKDATGVVTHFLGCQEDITERKISHEKIRDSEERFRQLADNMQEVFFVVSSDLRTKLYLSPSYEELWGRTRQSAEDDPASFIEGVVEEDREELFANIAAAQKGVIPAPVEFRVRRPDGSIRWVLAHAAPIKDVAGKVYRITGSALDVTDRRLAQEALRESETRFRLLGEATFDGVVISVDGIIREANQGLANIFGCTVDGAIGRPILDFVDPESHLEVKSRMTRANSGVYECVGRHSSGRKIFIEVAAKRYMYGGEVARIAAIRDVTERRVLENQFRQAQKMEAVGRLAGGVAHDFNNLLTVIMTYTEMLAEDLAGNESHREDLGEIRKASEAAASLTKQLLAFSRQQVVEPKLVLLEDVLTNADKMLRRLIGEDVELLTIVGDRCSVMIDPHQLEQVIMNLAVNARDAMPAGGKLTLETSIVELDAEYARDHWPAVAGRFAMLAVSDTGVGMDEETRARIFEPFFTTKEVGKGTGLGLATVYGIVKQSNGFIWVYSEPGKGTSFKLYFPLVAGETTAANVENRKPTRGTETILLVEDSSVVRAAAARILQRAGYTVLEAPTSRSAVDIAAKKQNRIDLLLTDVVMPGMSGREVAEEFARLRPTARVLYMSGYTDDAVVRHGILQPGISYLQKPFTGETLTAKVRAVLDRPGPAASEGHPA
ncbi:MAG TPA: PAS domain S-box protein [Gemmatimonadaceae bacterium]|nr:PAS domain S-box protein [Gemmatimonadaceae bacterium]